MLLVNPGTSAHQGGALARTCAALLSVKMHTNKRGWSYTIRFRSHLWKSKDATSV